MNRIILLTMLLISVQGVAQDILGQWATVDDQTNEKKAIITIFERDGEIFGKVIEIFDASKRDLPCIHCKGLDYNKPVLGLEIIKNMKKDGNYYREGTVINPENGKIYKLRLALDKNNSNVLQVRGYFGFFYQTQYWQRVKE